MITSCKLGGYRQQADKGPGRLALFGIALEKGHYPFKNYRHAKAPSVLFPGCNFPSLFPETCRATAKLLEQRANIGTAYDCCAKPLLMMGERAKFERVTTRIETRLSQLGCEEVVCVCPNCLYALRGNIPQRVVSVYAKLAELGIASDQDSELCYADKASSYPDPKAPVYFPPCPDRREGVIAHDIEPFLPKGTRVLSCNGTRGCHKGPSCEGCSALPCCRQDCSAVLERDDQIVTACASCCGYLSAAGYRDVQLALCRVLGIHEEPATSRSFVNRARTKLI